MSNKSILRRHVLKTISYRIAGTLVTVGVSYLIGASFTTASILGASELLLKPVLYFAHERVWYKYITIKQPKNDNIS